MGFASSPVATAVISAPEATMVLQLHASRETVFTKHPRKETKSQTTPDARGHRPQRLEGGQVTNTPLTTAHAEQTASCLVGQSLRAGGVPHGPARQRVRTHQADAHTHRIVQAARCLTVPLWGWQRRKNYTGATVRYVLPGWLAAADRAVSRVRSAGPGGAPPACGPPSASALHAGEAGLPLKGRCVWGCDCTCCWIEWRGAARCWGPPATACRLRHRLRQQAVSVRNPVAGGLGLGDEQRPRNPDSTPAAGGRSLCLRSAQLPGVYDHMYESYNFRCAHSMCDEEVFSPAGHCGVAAGMEQCWRHVQRLASGCPHAAPRGQLH